jgi:uncharacterized membrane protein YdjX (TVP38/TMEM64 family)
MVATGVLIESGLVDVVGYSLIVVALSLVCFPVTPLALTSIALLGPVTGPFVVALAITVATMIAFGLGRRFQGILVLLLKRFHFSETNIATVEEAFSADSVWPFLLLRNLPHPLMLVSYAAGSVADASFFRFGLVTLLTLLIRGALLAFFGEAILSQQLTWQKALFLAILLVLLIVVFRHLRRAALVKLEQKYCPNTFPE